ncbi:MAG: adenylate/guanylate cyclase domain-containing protein [Candidatus Ozemobacteraceae bacterium]
MNVIPDTYRFFRSFVSGFSALVSFLLPILLSLLPVAILSRDLKDSAQLHNADIKRQWAVEKRLLSLQLEEMAQPSFWVSEAVRITRKRLEKAVRPDVQSLTRFFGEEVPRIIPKGMHRPKVYAFFHGDSAEPCQGILLSGKGLETSFKSVFSRYLKSLGLQACGLPNEFEQNLLSQQIIGVLGGSLPKAVLDADFHGKCFPVLIERKFYFASWETIIVAGKPRCTFLFLFPNTLNAHRDSMLLTLKHHKKYFGKAGVAPLFIPVRTPADSVKPPILTPFSTWPAGVKGLCRQITGQMLFSPASGSEGIGRISLPGPSTYQVLESSGAWGYSCSLHPLSGAIGLFVGKIPSSIVPLSTIPGWTTVGILLFWGLFGILRHMKGRVFSLSVKITLLCWTLGLALIPVTLIWGTSHRMFSNMQSNRVDTLERELRNHLSSLETDFMEVRNSWLRSYRSLITSPDLTQSFDPDQPESPANSAILSKFWDHLETRGVSLQILAVTAPGNHLSYRTSPRMAPGMASSSIGLAQFMGAEILKGLVAESATNAQIKKTSTFQKLFTEPDSITELGRGRKKSLCYYNFFPLRNGKRAFLMAIWEEDSYYGAFLKRKCTDLHTQFPDVSFSAFRMDDTPVKVAQAGDPSSIRSVFRDIRLFRYGIPTFSGNERRVFLFSQKIPGHLFTASKSERAIHDEIGREKASLLVILSLLLILAIAGTIVLSGRIADPILSMTANLDRVAHDDLAIRVSEYRQDEIGDAGKTLDMMTRWLAERRNISRFVAPQVLEVLGKGEPEELTRATEREAVTLVSDIRSFTTLSEAYPPEMVFSLINRHLQIMTRAIQKHGGAIDRFIGDAVQAVFYQTPGASSAERAISSAIEMMDEHRKFNEERIAHGLFPYSIGIGIDHGSLLTGVIGDPAVRLDFSVLGEPMKHAGDLEAASKCGKATRIVCSGTVKTMAGESFEWIPLLGSDCEDAWEIAGRAASISPGVSATRKVESPADSFLRPVTSRVASGISSGTTFHASSWFILAFGLVSILIPCGLTLRGLDTIEESFRATRQTQVQSEFQNELSQAEKCMEPRLQISMFLRAHAENSLKEKFSQRLEILNKATSSFDSIWWGSFELPLATSSSSLRQVRTMFGGTIKPMSDSFACGLFLRFMMDKFPGRIPGSLMKSSDWAALGKEQESVFGVGNWANKLIPQSFSNLTPITLNGTTYFFLWVPAVHESAPVSKLSAVFFLIPESQLTSAHGNRAFVSNLSRRNLYPAILPVGGKPDPSWIHDAYTQNPILTNLLGSAPRGLSEHFDGKSRWASFSGSLSLSSDQSFNLILARKIPGEPIGASILRWCAMVFFGGFLLAWMGVFLNERLWKKPIRVSLKAQMVGSFLLMILPIVLQGMIFLERSFAEQTCRFEADRFREADERLRIMEKNHSTYFACFLRMIQDRLTSPSFMNELSDAEVCAERDNGDLSKANGLAWKLYKALATDGLILKDPIVGGPHFFGSNYLHDADKNVILQRKFLHETPSVLLQRFRTGGKSAMGGGMKDVLLSAGTEIVRNAVSTVIPPEILAEQALGLRFFTQLSFSKDIRHSTMMREFLFAGGIPRFSFQAIFPYEVAFYHQARTWEGKRHALLNGDLPWMSVAHRARPAIVPSSPVWNPIKANYGYAALFLPCMEFSPEAISETVMQSFAMQSVLSRLIPFADEKVLMSVLPKSEGDPVGFVSFFPFSRALAEELRSITEKRGLLFLLVLLCLAASWHASESFLKPVLLLSVAARDIRSGNFHVRLSERFEGEFLLLAQSFNQMARGVEEGRILSKFVSESVRMTAKGRAAVDGSDKGKTIRVSVIFAGLSRFKYLMAEMPPEELVVRLNTYLEAMSGIIRKHGGEIDKFIGDKILAVFHELDPKTGDSARNAVSAALDMQSAMDGISDQVGSLMGIGIVTGSVLSGILGTAEVRLEHTVLGDTVNLSSRLGDIAQQLDQAGNIGTTPGGGIVIEAETRMKLGDFPAGIHPLKLPPIKGKTRSVEAYRVTS